MTDATYAGLIRDVGDNAIFHHSPLEPRTMEVVVADLVREMHRLQEATPEIARHARVEVWRVEDGAWVEEIDLEAEMRARVAAKEEANTSGPDAEGTNGDAAANTSRLTGAYFPSGVMPVNDDDAQLLRGQGIDPDDYAWVATPVADFKLVGIDKHGACNIVVQVKVDPRLFRVALDPNEQTIALHRKAFAARPIINLIVLRAALGLPVIDPADLEAATSAEEPSA